MVVIGLLLGGTLPFFVAALTMTAVGRAAQGMVEQAYARAIERGQAAGEIDKAKDAQSLARYIMACLAGMICLSKSGFDAPMLRDISATAMQAIK